jgi:hypothetical protein
MSSQPAPTLSLPGTHPLALLPVRIETRFNKPAETNPQYLLYVRIYPDDLHTDTHEPALTEAELNAGQQFLNTSATDAKAAWTQLATQFGPQRAAWIAQTMQAYAALSPPATPPTRASSWTRAPYTNVLPDYWLVRGYLNNTRVVNAQGNKIKDNLPTGPKPDAQYTGTVDAGMLWLTDLDEAIAAGMALSIPVSADVWKQGLDRLVVFGVKAATTLNAAQQGERLNTLLTAQHYTRGLAFMPQDTPTNNTTDAPANYSAPDPNFELSYRVERGADLCQTGDGSNGDVTAKAFGLPLSLFKHTRFAGGSGDYMDAGYEQLDARHTNTALWSATLGYYLSQLAGDLLTSMDESIALARRHFIDYVRGRGPLPALRIGRQPYGVLPVISLDQSASTQEKDVTALLTLLKGLREVWRRSLAGVTRLGSNARQELMQSLMLEPTSSSYVARNFFGPHYLTYLWDFVPDKFDDVWRTQTRTAWWNEQGKQPLALLSQFKYESKAPRLLRMVAGGEAFPLMQPLVQNGGASETATLAPNYIRWLRQHGYNSVKTPNFADADINFKAKPLPLLFMLLRHSLLFEYAQFAHRYLPKPLRDPRRSDVQENAARFEPELVNISPDEVTFTVWEQLKQIISTLPTTDPVGVYLDKLPADSTQASDLSEFRRSLDWLATRPTAVLERLLPETLDLCAYRLDAWITSLATRRLAALRQASGTTSATGIFLGAYGFIEDLRPAATTGRTYTDSGFIHTPSLAHAAAAAILRNGYLSHGQPNQNGAFAVNLSSDRVRLALLLLEGVRAGQPLGALLGYRFERGLHDRKLSQYVNIFRKLAPLTTGDGDATTSTTQTGAQESVAANNVADGLTLHKRFSKGTIPWGTMGLPTATTPNNEYLGIYAELQTLDKTLDALGDLMVAESVYQTARGNHARASAVLDALGRGDAPPPDIEVVSTPRTGTGLTHRLFVAVKDAPPAPIMLPQYGYNPHYARAYAEPYLNAWVAGLLGDLTKVRCRIEYLDPTTGASLPAPLFVDLWLKDLDLTPLDIIYMAQGTGAAQRSELEQRFIYRQLRTMPQPAQAPPSAQLRLDFARQAAWPASDVSVAELLEVAQAIRTFVTSARPLEPRDLTWPQDPNAAATLDINDLANRASYARTGFSNAFNMLKTSDLDALRESLLNLARFGIADAVPVSAVGDTPDIRRALLAQASGPVYLEAQKRLKDFDACFCPSTATAEQQRQHHVKRLQTLFGASFNVLTRFRLPATSGNLPDSFNASKSLQGEDELASNVWFQRVARVREGAARLDTAMLYAEALNANVKLKFQVAQMPYAAGDRWAGLPLGAGQTAIPAGRLSLVALAPEPLNFSERLTGLVVDEWVEVVPNTKEATGLAFQYNTPNARPPQAILLAVPPYGQTAWTIDTLEATIAETFELAKLRLVDPDMLLEAGNFLPALFLAFNKAGDTISTDLTDNANKGTA